MKKRILFLSLVLALLIGLLAVGGAAWADDATQAQNTLPTGGTLACIGDSITYGQGVRETRDEDSYPAMLQKLLGDAWTVYNFGNPGSTLMEGTNKPYTEQPEYAESLELAADVSIIMLGTNDAKGQYWNAESYKDAYQRMIDGYREVNPDMLIVLMLPPTVYSQDTKNPEYFEPMEHNVDDYVVDCVSEIAEANGLLVVDLHTLTAGHPDWYADGLHPNKKGNEAITAYIYQVLTGGESSGN